MTPVRLRTALPLLLLVGAAAPAQADPLDAVQIDTDELCPYGCIQLENGQLFIRMDPATAENLYGSEGAEFCVELENDVFTILNTLSYYGPTNILDAIRGGFTLHIDCLNAGYFYDPALVDPAVGDLVDPTVFFLVHSEPSE